MKEYKGYIIKDVETQKGFATIVTRAVYKNDVEVCKALTIELAKEKIDKLTGEKEQFKDAFKKEIEKRGFDTSKIEIVTIG